MIVQARLEYELKLNENTGLHSIAHIPDACPLGMNMGLLMFIGSWCTVVIIHINVHLQFTFLTCNLFMIQDRNVLVWLNGEDKSLRYSCNSHLRKAREF
jgi:hypothetical protein